MIRIVGVRDFQSNFWLPVKNLSQARIEGNLSCAYELRTNDILLVRSNGNKKLIGRTLLAGRLTEKTSHSGFTIRVRIKESNLYPEFLTYYLKCNRVHNKLIEAGDGANISSLNQKALASLEIAFPSQNNQNSIISQIKEIEVESTRLENIYQQKLTALAELKQSLLQKAFSGELTADAADAVVTAQAASA